MGSGNSLEIEEIYLLNWGFPGASEGKVSACSAGDPGLISGLGRSPGEGKDYPLQYSCLENSMDRGAWWGYKELDMTEWLPLSFFKEINCRGLGEQNEWRRSKGMKFQL